MCRWRNLVADTVHTQLTWSGYDILGSGTTLIMDAAAVEDAVQRLRDADFDLLILLQASFADSSMAVALAETVSDRGIPILLWAVPEERSGGRLRLNSLCGINLAGHAQAPRHRLRVRPPPADDARALETVDALARLGERAGLAGESRGCGGRAPRRLRHMQLRRRRSQPSFRRNRGAAAAGRDIAGRRRRQRRTSPGICGAGVRVHAQHR
ncbi:MAG: hypothetical protein R2856_18040 [Caldilineaceae bacterium]